MKTRAGHWSDKSHPPPLDTADRIAEFEAQDESANRFSKVAIRTVLLGYVAILAVVCVLAIYFLRK